MIEPSPALDLSDFVQALQVIFDRSHVVNNLHTSLPAKEISVRVLLYA